MDYSALYISISMFYWKVNISHNWHSGEGTSTSLKQNSIYVECTRLQLATLFMLIMLLSIQRFIMIQQTFATLAVFDKWKFLQCKSSNSPLHKIALLRPKASAVDELMCSTIRCFIFFMTVFKEQHKSLHLVETPA